MDLQNLNNVFNQYGNIVYIGTNEPFYLLIVVSDFTGTIDDFYTIMDTIDLTEYPHEFIVTLVDGVLKAQYNKEKPLLTANKI